MGRRLNTLKRFGIALAVSAGIHFGVPAAGYGVYKGINHLRNLSNKQEVMHEEIQEIKPDVKELEAEKQQYIRQLHWALFNKEEIDLSDFFIRSEALDYRILNAKRGKFGPTDEEFRKEYDKLVALGKYRVEESEQNEMRALYQFTHREVLSMYYHKCDKFEEVPKNGCFNCLSSTELFSALMEDILGKNDYQILLFDDHIATYVDGKVIENTSHHWKQSRKKYDGCGLIAPKEMFIAAYLVKNGVDPEELPPHFSEYYSVKKKFRKCIKNDGIFGGLTGRDGFPKPGILVSLEGPPKERIPNKEYDPTIKDLEVIMRIGKALVDADKLRHLHDEEEYMQADVNGNKMLIYPIPMYKDANWTGFVNKGKTAKIFSNFSEYIPEEKKDCHIPYGIPIEIPIDTIDSIEALEGNEKSNFGRYYAYNPEYFCEKMKNAIEQNQDLNEYLTYAPLCPENNDLLKKRYVESNDENILRALIDMKNEDNMYLFISGLDSENEDIVLWSTYGMIFIDREAACRILDKHHSSKSSVKQYAWLCLNDEETWKELRELKKRKKSDVFYFYYLSGLSGDNITEEQYKFVKKIFNKVPVASKLEIARIAYEYGDEENAIKYTKKITKTNTFTYISQFCDLPPELFEFATPMLEKEISGIPLAVALVNTGEYEKYIDELVPALRKMILTTCHPDDQDCNLARIISAYLFLKMDIDPLKYKKPKPE